MPVRMLFDSGQQYGGRAFRDCMHDSKKTLSRARQEELFAALKARFENNMSRHKSLTWNDAQARLEAHPAKLWSLDEMERTGGEPDVERSPSK